MSNEDDDDEEIEERLTADSYGAIDTSDVTDECWLIRIPQKLAQAWESLPEGADLGELVFKKGGPTPPASAKAAEREAAKPAVTIHVAESVVEHFKQQSQQKTASAAARPGVIQTSNALPLNYSLQAMTKKIPVMHPFTRNPRTGSAKLWGTVTRTANLQVEQKDEQYRKMLKDRLVTTNINNQRYVKPVEATESVLSKQRNNASAVIKKKSFGDAVLQFGKRKLEAAESSAMAQRQQGQQGGAGGSKKARQFAPDQSMRSVVFELFMQNKFWAVKDLKQAAVNGGAIHAGTRKGESEIRDILREIGDYHRSGDHKNMWELRQEFQQQP